MRGLAPKRSGIWTPSLPFQSNASVISLVVSNRFSPERQNSESIRTQSKGKFFNRSKSSSVDYTQRLKSITIPTQILWGNEDEWISVENAKLFSKALPNNRVDIMQETGHLPMEERPYESLELLLNFINDN